MSNTAYRNFAHYINDGWLTQPKDSFRALADYIAAHNPEPAGCLLDVGCATGELMGFLGSRFPKLRCTGADIFDELLVAGKKLLPGAKFINASALELPSDLHCGFDFVTAMGVMSIFEETQIFGFWKNLLDVTKPGGLIAVLSPLNEYGVDTMIRHRKRRNAPFFWETGWNIFSTDTIRELLSGMAQNVRFEHFVFKSLLKPREDPVRTWTLPTAENPHQLTNGLKLLVDHYFMLVEKSDENYRAQ